jgi:hypothetical protein
MSRLWAADTPECTQAQADFIRGEALTLTQISAMTSSMS